MNSLIFCSYRTVALRVIVACAAGIWSIPAYAYLDPATGSVILQGLLAGIAGVMVVLRIYWTRIKSFTTRLFNRKDPAAPSAGPPPIVQKERP